MHRSMLPRQIFTWLLVITAVTVIHGQETKFSESNSEEHITIRKYVDSETVVVGWIDLTKIDVDELASFADKANVPAIDEQQKKRLTAIQKALLQLDAKRIYWIADALGFMQGPNTMVIPTSKPDATALLLGTIMQDDAQVVKVAGNCVLAGDQRGVAQLPIIKGNASVALLNALDGCKGSHGIAFALPPAMLGQAINVAQPLLPEGPEELAKAAEAIVAVRSLSLSGELPPAKATLRINSKSETAATNIASLLNSLASKRLGDGAATLKFVNERNDVVLSIDSAESAIKQLAALEQLQKQPFNPVLSLRQLGLALHNFIDVHKHLPPQSLVDKNGKRLLSWRVMILPFLEQQALYQQFHLDEPWDSEHNLKLAEQIPPQYAMVGAEGADKIKTRIVAPLADNSMFGVKGKPIYFDRVLDGTSNTIWFVEASPKEAVVWTKPQDLDWNKKMPHAALVTPDATGFHAGFADGAVRFIKRDVAPLTLNALITMDGGEPIKGADIGEIKH